MKHKRLVAIVMAVIFILGCTSAFAGDNKRSYHFNLGTMFYDPAVSTVYNADGEYLQKFVDLAREYSDGRIDITVHWGSILGGTADLVDQLRSGSLDLMAGSVYTANDKRFGVFYMPYLFSSLDETQDLFSDDDAPLGDIMRQIYSDNQIEVLSITAGQLRGIFNNKREIHVPSDVDFVFRTYSDDVVQTFWGGLTPNTTNIAISELYTALQLGTADGFEFNPCAMIANGYTDVLDYYTPIDWMWLENANLTMSQMVYNTVDPEDQEILKRAAVDAAAYYYEIIGQYNIDAIEYMKENGIEVYELTEEEREQWVEYGRSLWPTFKEKFGAETYDAVIAIVEEYEAAHK